ncbi:MAG: hypothetical protein EA359_05680 [Balneolaceae bacterium]|nr:MAG: hypothetical protein EA359_05680 [Balneolaceae bacterium]
MSFIIAGLTGFLYRYGMLYPLPEWLHFANIRHAHSHLMFFNWACPPIMAFMAAQIVDQSEISKIRSFKACLYTMLFFGFLSYPFFLLYGYHSVQIGSASLPIAAIISGLVMITWYWFAWLYIRERSLNRKSPSGVLFEAALLALIISSLGAWGVSVFQFTSIDSPLTGSAMTHFFLAVFTEGWIVLGFLGIMWSISDVDSHSIKTGWLWIPILFGSMLIFPFSLIQTLVSPIMLYTAKIGIILIIISMTIHLLLFIKSKVFSGFLWKTVIILIALKILFQVAAILPFGIWPGEHGLRVLYLHLLLLGIFSVIIAEVFLPDTGKIAKLLFIIANLSVIATLVMISGHWPPSFAPLNLYVWVMAASILPVLLSIRLYYLSIRVNC